MSLRIVHVDTARSWRGGQNQVLLAARGMASLGHSTVVACREGSILESRAREAGLPVWPLPFGADLAPRAILGLARRLREFRAQVVQLHDPHAASTGALACALAGGMPAVATRRVDFPLRSLLSRAKYRSARLVIAVSRAIARVLGESGLDPARVRVVYEGVPDRPRPEGGGRALRALGVPEGAPVVGNIAALVSHKDHETLLEAWARVTTSCPAARLVILGEGELRAHLEGRAAALGVQSRVIFAGFRNDVDVLLSGFDIFCLSSHMEGLGTSLLDAMAFGVPVVATAAGGIPEAVADGTTGWMAPVGDAVALGDALCGLLADPRRQAALGSAGRARFLAHFSDRRMVEETLKVYQEVLN